MKAALLLLVLISNGLARDITTLEGKIYKDCRVSRVDPDSICVLYSGGGARVKFTNLPEQVRAEFGYDAQQAAQFERAEAARKQRELAWLRAAADASRRQRELAATTPRQPTESAAQTPNYPISSPSSSAQAAQVRPGGQAAGTYGQALPQQVSPVGVRLGAQYVQVSLAPRRYGGFGQALPQQVSPVGIRSGAQYVQVSLAPRRYRGSGQPFSQAPARPYR